MYWVEPIIDRSERVVRCRSLKCMQPRIGEDVPPMKVIYARLSTDMKKKQEGSHLRNFDRRVRESHCRESRVEHLEGL